MIYIPGEPRVSSKLKETDVLWRYIDTAKFMDFIHNHTLFFSRGDKFEDKFEGAFTDSLKHAIDGAYERKKIDFTFEEFKRRLRERVFVNCWHKSTDDSMAMWGLYGQSNCSVAITTNVGMLHESLKSAKLPHEIAIEKVQYVKHWRNPRMNINPYSRVFAYKVKAYEFEKEVRVLIDRSFREFDNEMPETGMSIKINPQQLLRSVVIAPEAPLWFENLIRDVSKQYKIIAPVRRSLLAGAPV
jgi:hypothetical protein